MDAERVTNAQSLATGIQVGAGRIFRLKKPLEGPDLFASLVEATKADLRSPERSTVPMLAAWKDSSRALNELGQALNHPLAQTAHLSFEHGVPVIEGRGKPSFTDLMITTADEAIAVEAKYREPEYAT